MKKKSLNEVMEVAIQELRANGQWGTAHVYQSTANAFLAFCSSQNLIINRLTPSLLKEFEGYLRRRKCSWNTVSTYMRMLRAAYNRAVEQRWASYQPHLFEHVYTGIRSDRKKSLEAAEMGQLMHKIEEALQQPDEKPIRWNTEGLFVLMFLTRGLPFVDLVYLHKQDLQGNVLYYRRQKTGRRLRVTLSKVALWLVEQMKSSDESSPYLFPILRSRSDSEEAYREYQLALRNFNHRLARLGRELGIHNLSSYAARHTWATLAYHCEVAPGIISEAMGHSSIAVTETYLKPFHDQKIDEANRMVISFVREFGKSASL